MKSAVSGIGRSLPRKEGPDKVTGRALYNSDNQQPGLLQAWLVTSLYAHAIIKSIDTTKALRLQGVLAVVTGADCPRLVGSVLEDQPPLALDKVRYFGEPIAVVIAITQAIAKQAVALVQVEYEPLPVVLSPGEAIKEGASLVHERLGYYRIPKPEIRPQPGTNIAQHVKVRKGDMEKGWRESEVVVEATFTLPQSNHAYMEPRNVRAEIRPDGRLLIHTSSQAPFTVRKLLSQYFEIPENKIIVNTPLVGGAFGGKTPLNLEIIAFLATRAVEGRPVRLMESREQACTTAPLHIGLEARVKLGATREGRLTAAQFTFLVDTGAYTDSGPKMTRAMASDCTGPYKVENVWCDSLCVYTNHTFVTAFRGFGRISYIFALERTLDKLALALSMDPLELRLQNAIKPGDTSPTMVRLNRSNVGNLGLCLERLKEIIGWQQGIRVVEGNKVRAKGLSCFWKTSSSPLMPPQLQYLQ